MSRFAVIACVLGTGCFYIDPINQRPSIDIRQTSAATVYRNTEVILDAEKNDPEGQLVHVNWRVYACEDASDIATCDFAPFDTEQLNQFKFVVPNRRADVDVPVQSLRVVLEAQDDYGAIARPQQELIIPVADHVPDLSMSMRAKHDFIVRTDIELFAKISDIDDEPPSLLDVEWTVFSPMTNAGYDLDELDVADPDPLKELQLGKTFHPKTVGTWEVQVTVTDPLGASRTESLVMEVVADPPPCLAQWAPIAAPAGSAWPLTEATLFQVGVIRDKLDPYPTVSGDADLGTSTFSWSLKQPGASTRTPLGTTGNGVALDPGNYAPGDIVELRVEIADRNATPINCADNLLTCSVISDDQCIQRLTWRVEVY